MLQGRYPRHSNLNEISKSIRTLTRKRGVKEFVLVGGFNLPRINWGDLSSNITLEQDFLNMFAENSLLQCINVPTHRHGNTLDLLLTQSNRFVENITVHNESLLCKSDHYLITFGLKLKCKRSKVAKRKCYNFKNANWVKLNAELTEIDWSSILESMHPDTAWNNFATILKHQMNRHIPTIILKSESQPIWYDSECHLKCKEKERHHKKYKRTGSLQDGLKFATARKDFKKLVSQKMRENLYDYEDRNLLSKKFWSYVKRTSKSKRIPEIVCRDSNISSDAKTKANMFNKFFHDQFSEPSIYNIDISFDNEFDIDLSPSRIKAFLANININKACGPDEIPGIVLKMCSDSVALPLSIIYKLIYNTGSLPSQWKLSNVVPIFKKGDSKQVSNYRPISLLCIASKIMERIIHEETTLKVLHLIDRRQHGFFPNRSCATNLIQLIDDVAQSLHKNIDTDIIYFDFAKAFDTVSHDIILHKLKTKFKIDGRLLNFFQDYLKNRKQRVVLDNTISDILDVYSGVPQGSILGPLLFILFINDIYDRIDPSTGICLYADDTKIWKSISSENDCKILQTDVNGLQDWCTDNKMSFNIEKCHALTVKATDYLLTDELPFSKIYYFLDDKIIDYSLQQRDLGIIMNAKLNFQDHHQAIITKAYQLLGLTKRSCHFVTDKKRRRSLYLAMVRSQFEHCCTIWAPKLQNNIDKFEKVQKRAIKWILRQEYYSYSTYYSKCKETDLLPLSKHFELNDLLFFHKIINQQIDIRLPPYIHKYNGQSRLRNSHLDSHSYTYIPDSVGVMHSPLYKNFFYKIIHHWNNLSLDIRSTECFTTFKRLVKTAMWDTVDSIIECN